jgi:hypothetical protein
MGINTEQIEAIKAIADREDKIEARGGLGAAHLSDEGSLFS